MCQVLGMLTDFMILNKYLITKYIKPNEIWQTSRAAENSVDM